MGRRENEERAENKKLQKVRIQEKMKEKVN
jgi:hypothetical protein